MQGCKSTRGYSGFTLTDDQSLTAKHCQPPAALHFVQVQYDSAMVGARDIIAVVYGLGYEAALLQNDELSAGMGEREKEKQFWRQKVIWSLLFSVPVFLLAMVFTYLPRVKEGLDTSVGGFTVNELVQWILTTPVQVRLPLMWFE